MAELRLWSWNLSPFAGKVRVAFAEKGVGLDLLEIDPRQRPARLRELNPSGRVPVLEVDGTAIWESTAICEWLQDAHPEPPLWPRDATERASARARLRFVDDELTANFFLAMRKEAFGLDPADHPDVVSHLRERLVRRWRAVERLLGRHEGPWMMSGAGPTFVDLAVVPLAVRLAQWRPDLGPDEGEHPLATAWLAQLRERPSTAEVSRKGTPVSD